MRIDSKNITKVYSGAPGCACGCRGNYSSSKGSITRILKKLGEAKLVHFSDEKTSDGEGFVYWDNEDGTRSYTIYFKE